ncbi:MAG: PAS domain-containing protein [Gallionella sp.]
MGSLHVNAHLELPAERFGPTELTLDELGMILDCSDSAEDLLEYVRIQLIGQPVSRLLPKLSAIRLLEDGKLNPQLRYLCRCGHRFLTKGRYGSFSSELIFVILTYGGITHLRLIMHPYAIAGF